MHYLGLLTWLTAMAILRPTPKSVEWGRALLGLATLVLVPCAARWRFGNAKVSLLTFIAGALFAVGVMLPATLGAVALVIPWLLLTFTLAAAVLLERWRSGYRSWSELGLDGGWWFLPVGASWALLDRLEIRPLGFEPVIVLLTAIHFHYAGFVLPILAGRAAQTLGSSPWAVWGVVFGVPGLAVGITATQLGASPVIESMAALFLVVAAALVGAMHIRLSMSPRHPTLARLGWLCAGLTILASVGLAAIYGLRHFMDVKWLDIPTMRAWHGSANALGFGLIGMLAWDTVERCKRDRPSPSASEHGDMGMSASAE